MSVRSYNWDFILQGNDESNSLWNWNKVKPIKTTFDAKADFFDQISCATNFDPNGTQPLVKSIQVHVVSLQ